MPRTLATVLLAAAVCTLWGQSPAAPAFEAASIKPSAPGKAGGGINTSAARIRIVNSPLKFCIQIAWNVKDFQVSGGAGWMDSERYDIEAVAASAFKEGEYRAMLQTLLTDRFGLVTHRETRERSGYALVPGRNGAKLEPPDGEPGIMFNRTPTGDVTLKATSVNMGLLAGALSSSLGTTVVDRTGVEGLFNASLQFTPDPGTQPLVSKSGTPLPPPPPDAAAGPSIFSAIQEKLGLKLEAIKVPVEVIVIDRANRPSMN